MADMVNHPPHYKDASGIECIEVTGAMGFCGGNCFEYLYRAGNKGDSVQDLKKAHWYARRASETWEQTPNSSRVLIYEVAKRRDYNRQKAMNSVANSEWAWAIHWIGKEIAALESKEQSL